MLFLKLTGIWPPLIKSPVFPLMNMQDFILKKGKYYDLFFNYKGRLKHYPNYLQEESLESIISECNYDDDTTNEICIFLRKMLCINPNLRSTTNELLKDNFLKPIKKI